MKSIGFQVKKVHATVMTSHDSSSVEVQTCCGDVLVSSNWFRQKPTTKTVNVSITCLVTLSINYSVTTPSQAVHQSAYCLEAQISLLFLKGGPWVIEGQRFEPLSWSSSQDEVQAAPGTPVSNSCPQWAGAPLLCLFVTLLSLYLSVATC